ncbi:MAG TPA: GNAT family N-acetyltransferase, partial [Caulobacteraceae bacterium]|nr:GNAT family N-acetyltransferase [Caulobacteraceae bacterium]
PHFNWFLRADGRREAERARFFNYLICTLARAGRIDRPQGGGAAAVWMPSAWVTEPTSLVGELRSLPTVLRATGLSRLGRMMRIRKVMDAHHPTDREHLYLWFLGVTPRLQGMGIGSRLLRAGLNRADEAGLPAYLETGTEKNVALYRRHGFEPIHAAPVARGGPMMWHMWREPERP